MWPMAGYLDNYHDFCSDEINSIIPPKASFARNTRFSKSQHPKALKLDTNRTNAFANSFIPMTSRDWCYLPPTVFPVTYNLQSFKTRNHEYLQPLNLFLLPRYKGPPRITEVGPFRCNFLLYQYHYKKKKKIPTFSKLWTKNNNCKV